MIGQFRHPEHTGDKVIFLSQVDEENIRSFQTSQITITIFKIKADEDRVTYIDALIQCIFAKGHEFYARNVRYIGLLIARSQRQYQQDTAEHHIMNKESFEAHRLDLKNRITNIDVSNFENVVADLYKWQKDFCPLYSEWCHALSASNDFQSLNSLPFLPISAFKHHTIRTGEFQEQKTFLSSGTTMSSRASHYVRDLKAYLNGSLAQLQEALPVNTSTALHCLLPSYLEQGDSSLIAMMDYASNSFDFKGYFTSDFGKLAQSMESCFSTGRQVWLFGVSYALLDFAESFPMQNDFLVTYTGGMKGRRTEMTASELEYAFFYFLASVDFKFRIWYD